MRVLLTTPYDLAVPGGVNRHALDLLDALSRRGHQVILAGPASAEVFGGDDRIVRLGRVWVGAFNGAQSRLTLDLGIGAAVRRLVSKLQPEVVHAQEPFVPTLNTFALLHAGTAARVGTFHTFSETSQGYLWAWPWCRWVNRRLDARVAVSMAAREFATRFHPADVEVIPNGVRLPAVGARRPEGPPQRPVRVLFIGRGDEPRKGLWVLRAALALLERRVAGGFVLVEAGPGTSRGRLSDGELRATYAAADVCVVPSLGGESFGLVVLEALAHGVPVVASNIRGHAEWLADAGVGELFAAGDATALADAVQAVTTDPVRHAACAERALALAEPYDWMRIAGRLEAVYATACSKVLGRG